MKRQTFISFEYTNENDIHSNYIYFKKFTCKRIETIKKLYIEAFHKYGADSFMFENINIIKVYAIPDGYTKEDTPSAVWTKKELLSQIKEA